MAIALQLLAMFWAPLGGVLGTMAVSRETLLFYLASIGAIVIVIELTKRGVVLWQRGRYNA